MTAKDFKMIYDLHFDDLRRYLIFRSGDQELSGDIAQNVFMKVWTKKIDIASGNIKSLIFKMATDCLLYTSPSPRDATLSRMPSSA